jgi:hypothetical protein
MGVRGKVDQRHAGDVRYAIQGFPFICPQVLKAESLIGGGGGGVL